MPTLRELANLYAKKQPKMVDNITEEAPILASINFEEASHGLWNVYEELSSVTGPGFVAMNAPLPTIGANTDIKKVDLNIMGGEMDVPEDTAKMFGGPATYFSRKQPAILREAGRSTEVAILYNNLAQYAHDRGSDWWINAGGSAGAGYSIMAVRWIPGEVCGLYSPDGFKKGAMLDITPIGGGSLYKRASDGVLVYGIRMKGYFGLQIANEKAVNCIFNIKTGHLPTKAMLDDLLDSVRATPGNSFLYCHNKCRNLAINPLKDAKVVMQHTSKEVVTLVDDWNGIPIVTSYNFLDGSEATRS